MWPRVDGMRSIELGTPGDLRDELNALVLAGCKTATAGLLQEYEREGEELEHVGEPLALLDGEQRRLVILEVTGVEVLRFVDVPWEFAEAEGEGDRDLASWREGHRRYWTATGTPVDDGTVVVCLRFRVV